MVKIKDAFGGAWKEYKEEPSARMIEFLARLKALYLEFGDVEIAADPDYESDYEYWELRDDSHIFWIGRPPASAEAIDWILSDAKVRGKTTD